MTYQVHNTPWNKGKGLINDPKTCKHCGTIFTPKYRVTASYWAGRNFCSAQCSRNASKGRPSSNRGRVKVPLAERFWSKVAKQGTDECWPWTGAIERQGYGKLHRSSRRFYKAHILSWTLHFGEVPKGLCVCHSCDNRACVNPQHLWLGTHAENMADMKAKGRAAKHSGAQNGRAKLSRAQVNEMIELVNAGKTQTEVAKQYGITQPNLSGILLGKTWKR